MMTQFAAGNSFPLNLPAILAKPFNCILFPKFTLSLKGTQAARQLFSIIAR